jgi:tripartite-type tricarboxylate transporter receptor subunit TctC
MKLLRRQFLQLAGANFGLAALALILVMPSGHVAWSQTARTIKIVEPNPPGGPPDILARLLAEQVGRATGLTMVIENRPGAGGIIGTEAVSRAPPNGNTLLITATPLLIISSILRSVNYDPLTSFEPICNLVETPAVIVVNSASPYRTLADLLNAAGAKPGELTLAAIGPGSSYQLGIEMLKRAANVNLTYIPFPGSVPAVTALLGEHVTSVFASYSNVAEQLNTGKLRALATGSQMRIEPLPNVPSVAESGYKDYDVDSSFGVLAPAKTPKETVSQLAAWFTAALQVPEVRAKLVAQGLYPVGMCGVDFANLLRKQYDQYGRVIREANIKAE